MTPAEIEHLVNVIASCTGAILGAALVGWRFAFWITNQFRRLEKSFDAAMLVHETNDRDRFDETNSRLTRIEASLDISHVTAPGHLQRRIQDQRPR